ncbi:MAG: DNA-directed RNA polymerase subunit beta' [Candidatus Parcubacteria bacterium]|nr:MAG: DNA-directed RNA polymerase subunit beta' [Candidatus Parcubacteria bacterium]
MYISNPEDIKSILIRLSSPDDILKNSNGEVVKPETINYRTGKPYREGLFSEIIFGPLKDFECSCGKYKGQQFAGLKCDRCGVDVVRSNVRRERMGHITLATPICHIWFLKIYPYPISLILDIPNFQLEKVIYYSAYIITKVNEDEKNKLLKNIEAEYKEKIKDANKNKKEIKEIFEKIKEEINNIKVKRVISDVEYYIYSKKYPNIFEVGMGADVIRRFLEDLDLEEEYKRTLENFKKAKNIEKKRISLKLKILKSFIKNNIRPEWMMLTILPVIPADLRPIVTLEGGKLVSSDLNDLYRRIINRNNRLKRLYEIKAPEIIIRNEKRMLQEAVDALLDNSLRKEKLSLSQRKVLKSLADMLRGKQGRFRQNLLGKRVDYSGRGVIVIDPNLAIDEFGLPKKIALEIFKPFIIYELLSKDIAVTIKQAIYLIESEDPEAIQVLNNIIKNKYCLLNRAPTLHRLGIQAFKPILVEGMTIKIPPLVCTAFNADFDGDQMAVFLPLSEEAQKEAEELILASKNNLKPGVGEIITNPTKDIILGIYYLTQLLPNKKGEGTIVYNEREAKYLYFNNLIDLQAEIIVKMCKNESNIKTTVGRLIFNEILPEDYPFINQVLTKKVLSNIIEDIYDKYGNNKIVVLLENIKKLGFYYATYSGISWSYDDLKINSNKYEIIKKSYDREKEIIEAYESGLLNNEEKKSRIISLWLETSNQINNDLRKFLNDENNPKRMIDSGARGSYTQLGQMAGMKGLVENPKGEIIDLPIIHSYKEGLSPLEYFISTHGARKGASDTALKTARAGYLTRRMVDVAHDLITIEEDCGDEEGIVLTKEEAEEVGETLATRIFSRVSLETIFDKDGNVIINKGDYIDRKLSELIAKNVDKIIVRSPFTCKSLFGICSKCYGFDLAYNKPVKLGTPVGIIAAQSIGEPATQLTMRTFHVGGVAGAGDITQGVPRAEEILEARKPKNYSVLSPINGKIVGIEKSSRYWKITIKGIHQKKIIIHVPLSLTLNIKLGERVKKGQALNEGVKDPKEIYVYHGKMAAFKYIINEIKKVYNFQGAEVHDKHLEIIIRKMFSRVKIKEVGDSDFVYGDIVEKDIFLLKNKKLKMENKKPAKGILLLLGITKTALTSESFLSSASFQETARVLTRSALESKEDYLRGLKENIILGRKPFIGNNFRKIEINID